MFAEEGERGEWGWRMVLFYRNAFIWENINSYVFISECVYMFVCVVCIISIISEILFSNGHKRETFLTVKYVFKCKGIELNRII